MVSLQAPSALAQSPLLWALETVRIPMPDGAQPFQPYKYQGSLLADRSTRQLILKARQVGITLAVAIREAHAALFQPQSLVLIISRDQKAAADVLSTIYDVYDGLDEPPALTRRNTLEATLANGSRIISQAATAKAGRGYRATSVVLDEAAFMGYDERIYRAVSPTLSRGGRLTVISTPDGQANLFYRLWQGQEGGDWSRHRVHWRDCPVFDEAWYAAERWKYTNEQWASEYECDFVGSGSAVFNGEDVDRMRDGWRGLQRTREGRRYMTAWDPGRRRDPTVGITLDITELPYQVVAFERLVRAPYAQIESLIDTRAASYGGETRVESNSIGDPLLEALSCEARPFVTTAESKAKALTKLVRHIENGEIKCGVDQVLAELRAYQWDDKKLVQDCVMSLAIAVASIRPPPGHPGLLAGVPLDEEDWRLAERSVGVPTLRRRAWPRP